LLFGFKNGGGEPNWPITAYLSGLVLAVVWLVEELQQTGVVHRRLLVGGVMATSAVGLLLIGVIHFSGWVQPLLARLTGPATVSNPLPLRRLDPTCRLKGWRTLAAEVDRVRAELSEQGQEPILAGVSWNLPGMIGFYSE